LITQILWVKLFNVLKKYWTNKIPTFGVILLFIISSASIVYSQHQMVFNDQGRAIVWDVLLNFNEPGSAYDYTIFGEAPDAIDGPPADLYDTAKPPAPMPSYIRVWLNDNLPFPYNTLWRDYRHFPDLNKVWNFSVQWVPADSVSPTTITIDWSPNEINTSEYISIQLCTSGGTPILDMRQDYSYSFECPAFFPQTFKIICSVNQPPDIPSNPSPSNNSITVPVNTNLSWTCGDPDGDPLTYNVYFGTSTSPPKVADNISTITYDVGTMNPYTTYYWKIVAWDNHSDHCHGRLWHFQTNQLPNQPGTPSPTNNSEGISISAFLNWTCSDPNGDPLTFDVYFGTSASPPRVAINQTGTSYDPILVYGTMYYWQIKAWDINSGPRAGPIWRFQTNSLPNPPSNPTPANNSLNVPITTILIWTGGDPDSGDTVTYDVYFGPYNPPPQAVSNQSTLSYDPPGNLVYDTLYYWKIVAWDNHGATRTGPLWRFITGTLPNQPPYVPNDPNPGNGSTGVSLTVDLTWHGGDPDPGDTVTYDVYFGMASSPPCVSHNQTTLLYDPGTLNSYTMYYWWIKAWDDHGHNVTGPFWHFKTEFKDNPPYEPCNPSPANGSTNVPVTCDLSWTGGDPDSDDYVTYDVYIGGSFPLPKIKSNTSGTSCALENLNYSKKYYWIIVSWDNHGLTNTSSVWSFTTKTDATSPSLAITQPRRGFFYLNILGGSIQRVFPIFVTTLVIGPIKVIATASDSQSGVNRVEFYVDDVLKDTDYTGDNNQYTWLWDERVPFFPYLLKAIAYDNCGNPSTLTQRVWKVL